MSRRPPTLGSFSDVARRLPARWPESGPLPTPPHPPRLWAGPLDSHAWLDRNPPRGESRGLSRNDDHFSSEASMRFRVECYFNETVMLGGMLCDSIDLDVEAQTARIAELKVLNCYPDLLHCEASQMENESSWREFRELLPWCCGVFAAVLVLFWLRYGWSEWPVTLLAAALLSLPSGFWACALWSEVESAVIRRHEHIAATENEYHRRIAYREGWTDCKDGASPKFEEWVEEDSRHIHPYPGPAWKPPSRD